MQFTGMPINLVIGQLNFFLSSQLRHCEPTERERKKKAGSAKICFPYPLCRHTPCPLELFLFHSVQPRESETSSFRLALKGLEDSSVMSSNDCTRAKRVILLCGPYLAATSQHLSLTGRNSLLVVGVCA